MKSGKCSNFGNCTLADAHTVIQTQNGMDFVCTECGKPLLLNIAAAEGGSSQTTRIAVVVAILFMLLGSAVWFMLHGEKSPPPSPSPLVKATPAPAPVQPAVTPVPTGHCSDVDATAGLCKKH